MRPLALLLFTFLVPHPVDAQERGGDRAAIAAELRGMFERPAGTTISDAQKDALAAFLERHQGEDLGEFGYVRALHHYLQRDYDGALAAADRFFAEHDAVPIEDHAAMLGRITMMGMMRGADAQARARHAERAARLYPDVAMIGRALPRAMEGIDAEGQRTLRLAVVRGALAGDRPAAQRDALIAAAYASVGAADDRGTVPARAIRATPAAAGATDARQEAQTRRDDLAGAVAPQLDAQHVVGAAEAVTLEGLRGKVVVLDFTATWCGPCRRVIPAMIALQKAHPDSLQVVGVTRLYGYGSDFRGDAGGARVDGLDRDAELAVNRAFAEHFELNYPVVVVPEAVTKERYGVAGIPTMFVIGKDGKVVGHAVGATDQAHAAVEAMVQRALAD